MNDTSKYYRITAYYPPKDITFTVDSNGYFDKLWQFSAFLVSKGCKVLEVEKGDEVGINIDKIDTEQNKIILRASAIGKPIYPEHRIDSITHKVIVVDGKQYIPE